MINESLKITGVTFVIVRPNNEILLQLRDENSKYYPNKWCFPEEGSEGDEKLLDMVSRGVQEEFGMEVKRSACELLTINHLPHISQEVAVVICKIDRKQVPQLKEGKEIQWMTLNKIKRLGLGFEQNKFLPLLEKYFKKHNI